MGDDSPCVIGGGIPPMPTAEEAWMAKYVLRMVEHGVDAEFAWACCRAGEDDHDYTSDPSNAADEEMSVKRFDVAKYEGLDESDDGDYVEYSAYADLESQLAEMSKEIERLKNAITDCNDSRANSAKQWLAELSKVKQERDAAYERAAKTAEQFAIGERIAEHIRALKSEPPY